MSRRAHHSARVNIDDAARQALHVRAIQTNRPVADETACRGQRDRPQQHLADLDLLPQLPDHAEPLG